MGGMEGGNFVSNWEDQNSEICMGEVEAFLMWSSPWGTLVEGTRRQKTIDR